MNESPTSVSGRDPRLASVLQTLLFAAAGILAVIAAVLPAYRLTQDQAIATVNLTQSASTQALATVQLPTSYVEPTGADGLTVNLVVSTLDIDDPQGAPVPWYLRLLTELGTSIWALGLAFIAYLLARVLGNIAAGDPFHESHARRFTWMAIAILIISVGADTVNFANAWLLTRGIGSPPELAVTPYYSLIPIALAAVTLVLAGAFRSGRQIQQDTEGLV